MGHTVCRAMPEKGRRSASVFAAVLALVVAAGLSLFAVAASGSPPPPLTVKVDGAGAAAPDAVSTSQTYSAFKAAVSAKVAGGTLTLPFSFQGAHVLTVTAAQVDYDDTDHAVAFTGTVTLPGFQGGETPGANGSFDFLVTAVWPDGSSATPKLALVTKTSSISLANLNTLWGTSYGGVTFDDALLGLSSADQTLEADTLPAIAKTFIGSGSSLDLKTGVGFRGSLNLNSRLTDVFGYAGWGGSIDLEGQLSTSPEMLFGDASDAELTGLDLKVTLGKSSTAPEWLTDRTTTFEFSLDSAKHAKLQAHDDVTVAVDGTTNEFTGNVSIASTGEIEASLGNIGTLDVPFGLESLGAELGDVNLGLAYDGTSLEGTLGFEITLSGHTTPFTVDAGLKVSGGSVSADLTIEGDLSVQDVATLGAGLLNTTPVTIPSADAFTLKKISFEVEHGADENIFSVGGTATVRSLQADAVFTLRKKTGEPAKPLLGLALSDPTCGDAKICLSHLLPSSQLGDLAADIKFPAANLIATPSNFTSLEKSELTTPELNFFSAVYGTVPDTVTFGGGLSLTAKIAVDDLPSSVRQVFGWPAGSTIQIKGSLGSAATASGLDGQSANLTGLSLNATFPTSSGSTVLPSWISFTSPTELSLSFGGGTVKAGLSTAAHVDLGSGFDVTLDASFAKTPSGSTIDVKAGISSWTHPFGLTWLNITSADLAVSAKFGGGPAAVSAELNGDIDVGGQPFTLHAALDVGDATKATVSATYHGTTTLGSIAGLFGDLSNVSSALNSSLSSISVGPASVTVSVGSGSTAFAFSATANFTSPATGHTIGATVLAVAKTGGGFTFGLKVDASDINNLSDLVSGAPDVPIAINSGILVLASQDATLTKSQLTDPEFDFYKSLYGCAADTTRAQCTKFDSIAVTRGLKLEAGVNLPESVEADAAKIGIPATGNLLISGQIPIFGGTSFSLTVELGNFRFDKQPDWFDHGSVSLTISTSGLKFSGELGMRIRRKGGGYDETNCPDGSVLPIVWNDETQGSACYDKLNFTISAAIDYSNPAEPGIEVAGVLSAGATGWHHAFGQSWLTINHVALELGVKITPTGPEVTLGFQGDVVIGSKDIEAAIKVGLATLQAPPFVRPDLIGFSLASNAGVSLSDVVTLQQAVTGGPNLLDTSSLPDVSIRNFFFQFSTENDTNLCLTQGLKFNGDLYVGHNLPTPDTVDLNPTGCRKFDVDPNSSSTSCIAHKANGCLASIGASVDATGIKAKGELSGFSLGPLEMKDSSFHLALTATDQSLFMTGGVKISSASYTFADGTATLAFSKDGFFFTGDASVFNGAFHAYIQTSAPFDFTNPSFTLKVWLRADVNAAIKGALSQGLQAVKPVLIGISQVVALFGQDGVVGVLQNLPNTLRNAGVNVPPDIQKIVDGIAGVAKQINDFGHATGFSLDFSGLLRGFKLPDFPGLRSTYVPSSRTCLFVVENGTCYTTPPWHTIFGTCCGVPGTWVDPICVGTVVISGVCWAVPPITGPRIPGLCSLIGIDSSSSDCSWGGLLSRYVLAPLVQKFNAATGLNLPTSLSQLQTDIDNLVSTINNANIDILSLDCAEFSLDAGLAAQGHVNVSLASKLRVFGHPLEFGFGWNFSNFNGNAGDVVKQIIQQLLNPHTTTCDPIPPGHESPAVAAQTIDGSVTSTLNEGGTATWTGTFGSTASTYPAVTVDWGDGSSDTIAAGTSKTVSKTHTYPQNGPHGYSHGEYTVAGEVNDAGGDTASSNVGVNNVAPSITAVTATPTTATENGSVTLTGAFTDPGVTDSHVLKVDWGDGSLAETFNLSAGARTFTKTHKYLDNPDGGSTFTITTEVDDDDTGVATQTKTTTVNNAAPSNFTLAPTSETTVDEGAYVGYTLTFDDPGTLDTHKVTVDWGDSTDDTTLDLDAGALTTELQHQFVDNGSYDVKATVADKDGGSTTQTLPIHVANVAPTVSFAYETGATHVQEGAQSRFLFNVADPGALDSQDVTVDWGDGTAPASVHLAADERSFELTHDYVDDNPTGTPSDPSDVQVTATDKDGGVGSDILHATVDNVDPTVGLSLDSTRVNENTVVKLSGLITDPGVEDTNTVVIDWGPGRTPADRITTLQLPASQRSFELTKAYGDDGIFPIHVKVTDDDTGVGTADTTLMVASVNPTAAIDLTGAFYPQGARTFIVQAGVPLHVSARTTDPGSDDLVATWTWQDGSTTQTAYPLTQSGADPHPSPQVGPRDLVDDHSHTWANACLYSSVRFDSADDDNGLGSDTVAVVVTGNETTGHEKGWWKEQYDGKGGTKNLGADRLTCYLRIVSFMSAIFPERHALTTAADALDVLEPSHPTNEEQAKLQTEILLSWLNFANGAFQYTQTAEDVMGFGERALVNAAATKDDLNKVREALSQLEDAQQTAFWLGVDKVNPLQAKHVTEGYKHVVDKLQEILKKRDSGLSAASVQQLIDEVNAAARALMP